MGFPKQEYWSGLPFPSPEHLPSPGMEPTSPALQADSLSGKPLLVCLFLSFRSSEWLYNHYKLCLKYCKHYVNQILPTFFLAFWEFKSFLSPVASLPLISRMCPDHHWLNGHEFEQTPEEDERQGSVACCSPWGRKELDMTEWLKNNYTMHFPVVFFLRWLIAFHCLQPQESWSSKNYGRSSVFSKSFLPTRMLT